MSGCYSQSNKLYCPSPTNILPTLNGGNCYTFDQRPSILFCTECFIRIQFFSSANSIDSSYILLSCHCHMYVSSGHSANKQQQHQQWQKCPPEIHYRASAWPSSVVVCPSSVCPSNPNEWCILVWDTFFPSLLNDSFFSLLLKLLPMNNLSIRNILLRRLILALLLLQLFWPLQLSPDWFGQ